MRKTENTSNSDEKIIFLDKTDIIFVLNECQIHTRMNLI